MAQKRTRVAALTGARAIAGLYILALHFGAPLYAHAPGWAQTLRANGYVATSFFLMLSGFVLMQAYGQRLADGRVGQRAFFVQRLARLYPCYLLALVLMIPFALVRHWGFVTGTFGDATVRYKLATFAAQATMTHVWVPRLVTSWNVPSWCVSVELWFYLAFPTVAALLVARRGRALVAVLALAWAATLAMSIAYTVLQPDGFHAEVESVGFWLSLLKFTPYTRWPELLFGMALGALWLRVPDAHRGRRWATLLLGSGALATVGVLVCGDRIPYTLLHNGALLPLYGLIVWGLMLGVGPLHRALSVRPLTTVGDASYVLYILQVPLMQWMAVATGRRYGAGGFAFTAAALAITIAASVAIHHLFEVRAQAWLRARLERRLLRVDEPALGLVAAGPNLP
ncbi:MAG: acyltransferase 3 [Myxococcales bacterium]|nr:acyltransferase 3 [Myxococcales bacterium]